MDSKNYYIKEFCYPSPQQWINLPLIIMRGSKHEDGTRKVEEMEEEELPKWIFFFRTCPRQTPLPMEQCIAYMTLQNAILSCFLKNHCVLSLHVRIECTYII